MAQQWLYSRAGTQYGPVTAAELRQLATSGLLSPIDLVWKEGLSKWVSAVKVKGLFNAPSATNTALSSPSFALPSSTVTTDAVGSEDSDNHSEFSNADIQTVALCAQRIADIINESVKLARESKVLSTKLSRIGIAKQKVKEFKELVARYPFVEPTTLDTVEECIARMEVEFEQAGYLESAAQVERGNTEPICPYCNHRLDKMPGRKKQCPECGQHMLVRTRPSDRKKILIREDQSLQIEEQWAIAKGIHDPSIAPSKESEIERDRLREQFGREPSENEIKWYRLNNRLLEHMNAFQWGLYRNDRLSMGNILAREGRYLDALDVYLEVCYLDLNGPTNCGTLDPQILEQFPPFNPKEATLAPGVIVDINDLLKQQELSKRDASARFLEVASKVHRLLNLPLAPDKAWRQLSKDLNRIG